MLPRIYDEDVVLTFWMSSSQFKVGVHLKAIFWLGIMVINTNISQTKISLLVSEWKWLLGRFDIMLKLEIDVKNW